MTLATTVPAFFMREKPTSSRRKPACMKKTRMPATSTQTVSIRPRRVIERWFHDRIVDRARPNVIRPRTGFAAAALYSRQAPLRFADGRTRAPDALGQLARVHLEQAVRIAGGGPDALVREQLLVEQHRQVVPEGRHAADREAGGGAHLVGAGLAHLGHVERVGELVGVDPVPAGRDAQEGSPSATNTMAFAISASWQPTATAASLTVRVEASRRWT